MLGLQKKVRRKAAPRSASELLADGREPGSRVSQSEKTSHQDESSISGGFLSTFLQNLGISAPSSTSVDKECDAQCWLRQLSPSEHHGVFSPKYLDEQDQLSIRSRNSTVYEPLGPWQTRLIQLQPGKRGEPLECIITPADVIDAPGLGISGTSHTARFEALSYSWGHPDLTCEILCNNIQFGVTKNLATALERLRLPDRGRFIWCDAICINQGDLPEKSRQVRNMLRIFEKADRVVAWLGSPSSGGSLELTTLFQALTLVDPLSYEEAHLKHTQACADARNALQIAGPSTEERLSDELAFHCQSAWYRRTWIRQEVYAAVKLLIVQGEFEIDFEKLCTGLMKIHLSMTMQGKKMFRFSMPPTFKTYQKEYQHFGSDGSHFEPNQERPSYVQYCLNTINTGRRFEVTDGRDRIYGALGLLTSKIIRFFVEVPHALDKATEDFPIEYERNVSHVHADFTKFLINATGTLEVLDTISYARHAGPDLKSWNLDFGQEQDLSLSFWPYLKAKGAPQPVLPQSYDESDTLKLRGCKVAQRIQRLDADKDIGHPADRFQPKYNRPISFRQIVNKPIRKASAGLVSGIDNPTFAFVFSHALFGSDIWSSQFAHCVIRPEETSDAFRNYLASNSFAFGYVEDLEGSSFNLAGLHLPVPVIAALGDVLVSLQGSKCLHLLRPRQSGIAEFSYIGPVVAVAVGRQTITEYATANLLDSSKGASRLDAPSETFVVY